jgi:hypothetical protein
MRAAPLLVLDPGPLRMAGHLGGNLREAHEEDTRGPREIEDSVAPVIKQVAVDDQRIGPQTIDELS